MRMKGVWAWIVICLWLLGSIGGIGYAIYNGAWLIAVGVLAIAVLSFFMVRKIFNWSNE